MLLSCLAYGSGMSMDHFYMLYKAIFAAKVVFFIVVVSFHFGNLKIISIVLYEGIF